MRLTFDVGGTFTDLVLLDGERGVMYVEKVLTTHGDPAIAVSDGVRRLLSASGVAGSAIDTAVASATTLFTNALIERKGGRTATVSTTGFSDILEIGREWRYDLYDLHFPVPRPLVPAELRFEVAGRIDNQGRELAPLSESDVTRVARQARAAGVVAIAVTLLHSYRNDSHEVAVARQLRELLPGVHVTLSSEVAPEIREYERTTTTVVNAYLLALAEKYFAGLRTSLSRAGISAPLTMMQSNGGVIGETTAAQYPVRLLESGPAAGALGAAYWARQLGRKDLVSFDMGGTTAKFCLIKDGQPSMSRTFEAARVAKLKKGSGLPLLIPVVDLIEIGAGGGSIAAIDELGLLKVGPHSAGSDPGPVCYGRGGELPTVTDADVVIGRIAPAHFLGGSMALDSAAAEQAIKEHVAVPSGMSVPQAAAGIVEVANEYMALAIQVSAAENGVDLRDCTMLAFGGAGPVHAVDIARKLGIHEVIVAVKAGVLSALGLHVAPVTTHLVRSLVADLSTLDVDAVAALFAAMHDDAAEELAFAGTGVSWRHAVDMRYKGQGYEIEIELDPDAPVDAADLERRFGEQYESVYGRQLSGTPIESVTWRVQASGTGAPVTLCDFGGVADGPAHVGSSPVWFANAPDGADFVDVPVYLLDRLAPGTEFSGPAIVQQAESSTLLSPRDRGSIDGFGHLHVLVGGAERGDDV